MSQTKDDWIQATGGLFATPQEQEVRKRVRELAAKLKSGGVSEDKRIEYLRLVDSLPNAEE